MKYINKKFIKINSQFLHLYAILMNLRDITASFSNECNEMNKEYLNVSIYIRGHIYINK